MKICTLCPRNCAVDRENGERGICGQTEKLKVARAALHYWEEPCISGTKGSGAVFFSGCSLHCVFCQNKNIANGDAGKEISIGRLTEIFLELQQKGANNINLVTPGHFVPQIITALHAAKQQGLTIPIVYNTSSYEEVDTIRRLEGLVDIYLPYFKYMDATLSLRYSHAADYSEVAKATIAEMVRQTGDAVFAEPITPTDSWNEKDPVEAGCLMRRGTIVRHLLLPGQKEDSKAVIRYLYETYGDSIYISIMNQFTPLAGLEKYPELNRRVTEEEYDEVVDYAIAIGVENGFIQEGETAEESFIPEFDGEGV